MVFAIQSGNPHVEITKETSFEYISSAIQTIFPMKTEDIIISWNHFLIRLNYKYDLCYVIGDIVDMLDCLLIEKRGVKEVIFGSDQFHVTWHMEWNESNIQINSHWERVSGQDLEILNRHNQIVVPYNDFLYEWKLLLNNIVIIFNKNKISISEDKELLEKMISIEKSIPQFGKLYSHLNRSW